MNKRACLSVVWCIALGFTNQACSQAQVPLRQTDTYAGGQRHLPTSPEEAERSQQALEFALSAQQTLDISDYETAGEDARKASALKPYYGDPLLAMALYGQGRYEEAFPLYKSLAESDGYSGKPSNELPYAFLLLKKEQWAQAVAVYDKAVSQFHKVDVEIPMSDAELVRSRYHFSPEIYQPELLETAIHLATGIAYSEEIGWSGNSQDSEALLEYRAALAMNPESDLNNYLYGTGLLKLHQTAKAKAAFGKAIRIGGAAVTEATRRTLKQADRQEIVDAQKNAAPPH